MKKFKILFSVLCLMMISVVSFASSYPDISTADMTGYDGFGNEWFVYEKTNSSYDGTYLYFMKNDDLGSYPTLTLEGGITFTRGNLRYLLNTTTNEWEFDGWRDAYREGSSTTLNNNGDATILDSNFNMYDYAGEVFFHRPLTALGRGVQASQGILPVILQVTAFCLGLLVLSISLRKAWHWLVTCLKGL